MGEASRTEVLDVSLKDLYRAITDYPAYPRFVTGMKAADVLEKRPGKAKVAFEIELMKRLKYVVDIEDQVDEGSQSAVVHWKLVSADMMKKNNGRWELKSLGPEKTEVRYQLEVELSFPVPGFIMKGLVANSLPTAIKEFYQRAQKLAVGGA